MKKIKQKVTIYIALIFTYINIGAVLGVFYALVHIFSPIISLFNYPKKKDPSINLFTSSKNIIIIHLKNPYILNFSI